MFSCRFIPFFFSDIICQQRFSKFILMNFISFFSSRILRIEISFPFSSFLLFDWYLEKLHPPSTPSLEWNDVKRNSLLHDGIVSPCMLFLSPVSSSFSFSFFASVTGCSPPPCSEKEQFYEYPFTCWFTVPSSRSTPVRSSAVRFLQFNFNHK